MIVEQLVKSSFTSDDDFVIALYFLEDGFLGIFNVKLGLAHSADVAAVFLWVSAVRERVALVDALQAAGHAAELALPTLILLSFELSLTNVALRLMPVLFHQPSLLFESEDAFVLQELVAATVHVDELLGLHDLLESVAAEGVRTFLKHLVELIFVLLPDQLLLKLLVFRLEQRPLERLAPRNEGLSGRVPSGWNACG